MKKTFIARLLATAITLAAVNAQAQGTAAAAAPAGLTPPSVNAPASRP